MIRFRHGMAAVLFGAVVSAVPVVGGAVDTQPWIVFEDFGESSSRCGVVNAGNVELVVLRDTLQLVIVTGRDTILTDTFVDNDNTVIFEGTPFGFLTFAKDNDGFRTLWWVTLTGSVVEIDEFTAKPRVTNAFPDQFERVPCDACEFWDDPLDCQGATGIPGIDIPGIVFNVCGSGSGEGAVAAMLVLVPIKYIRRRRHRKI